MYERKGTINTGGVFVNSSVFAAQSTNKDRIIGQHDAARAWASRFDRHGGGGFGKMGRLAKIGRLGGIRKGKWGYFHNGWMSDVLTLRKHISTSIVSSFWYLFYFFPFIPTK